MFELIDFLIVRPIANILFLIYNYIGDFGVAIILFTIIVKFCMWPLVKKQMHQAKLLRKIQPKLTEIKKNCNGNRQMESLQMMDLYKRYNVKPFRSVILVLIQLPIFIALYTAIRVVVMPSPNDNLIQRAYEPIRNLDRISEVVSAQETYLADTANNKYEFKPQLFGVIDLDVAGSSVLAGNITISTVAIFIFAVASALFQYLNTKQQAPSSKNSKSFRQLMKEASEGKEPDQMDLNAISTRQMSVMMPIMMFLIMFNLPGALAFYYLLSSVTTYVQQYLVLHRTSEEMEENADKAIIKELNKIQEAEVIVNKKTGTKITRITSKSSGDSGKATKAKSSNKRRK